MSNVYRSFFKFSVLPAVLCGVLIGPVSADEVATDVKPSQILKARIRDQRPDDTRGWMVVAKPAYWPLCYEALDRLNEAKELIGSSNTEEAADSFEKCSSWLRLAASAAMTDGTAGVVEAADLFQEAADASRDGKPWSSAEQNDLITLGFVVMAKSHMIRAEAPDKDFNPGVTARTKPVKNPTAEIKEIEKEIAKDRVAMGVEQYRYDTVESRRHLLVAQEYLANAADAGQFVLDPAIAAPIPELEAKSSSEMIDFVESEIRPRIVAMKKYIAQQRSELSKKLASRL